MTTTRTSAQSRSYQDVLKLVPKSIAKEIACFVFYDNHPQCVTSLDVTICTKHGEVIEFYQRQRVASYQLAVGSTSPSEISINRNYKAKIYYLVLIGDVLHYLLRNDDATFTTRNINNVSRYSVEDFECKVQSSDDDKPHVVNNIFDGISHPLDSLIENETISLEQSMNTQLNYIKHYMSDNEKKIKETKILRQQAAYQMYQNMHYPLREAVFRKGDAKAIARDISIRTESPWIKKCNGKLVIVIKICSENLQKLENIKVLMHVNNIDTLNYTTKFYQTTKEEPYWREMKLHNITTSVETNIVVLINTKELLLYDNRKIELTGVMAYRIENADKLLPLEEVKIPFLDVIDETFEVLSLKEFGKQDILAIIATSVKTELTLNTFSENDDMTLSSMLCKHLGMAEVQSNRLLIHNKAPYHVLNGVMLLIQERNVEEDVISLIKYNITVYTRNSSQIISLIHYLNDAAPQRIAVIYPEYKLVPLNMEVKDDKKIRTASSRLNMKTLAQSLLNQMSSIREHYDNCMIKMNQSTDESVKQKLGMEIDVFACSKDALSELRINLNENMLQGISELNISLENAENDISKIPDVETRIRDSDDIFMAVDSD